MIDYTDEQIERFGSVLLIQASQRHTYALALSLRWAVADRSEKVVIMHEYEATVQRVFDALAPLGLTFSEFGASIVSGFADGLNQEEPT